ncbi:hypothetical protein ScPMuIL_002705 [Solemya velum]
MSLRGQQYVPEVTTKIFGLKALKRYPELLPIVFCVSVPVIGGLIYIGYGLATKSDVRINKSGKTPDWENVEYGKNQKLLHFNQEYRSIPELEKLRKEIGSYKY